ncbi:hypothetical protein HY621_03870 [Candidatus Uhrbacteria bacterium]|nr:hypothetical protein [Candidatus Uhrbacteria bacterium]
MENFIFGMQGLAHTIRPTVVAVINHPLMWGFGIGFLASTCIHLFIITDIPHAIPTMLSKGLAESFQKIAPRGERGEYLLSFTEFQKDHARVRIAFYLALSTFLFVVALALLK